MITYEYEGARIHTPACSLRNWWGLLCVCVCVCVCVCAYNCRSPILGCPENSGLFLTNQSPFSWLYFQAAGQDGGCVVSEGLLRPEPGLQEGNQSLCRQSQL
jgi:hypothetical protein